LSIFEIAAVLVCLSALFGYLNHRFLALPHTIALVIMALLASLSIIVLEWLSPDIHLSKQLTDGLRELDFNDTLMNGMLSFMLFAGAMHVNFDAFKARSLTIGIMATLGTLISTFLVGGAMWWLLNLFGLETPFIWALVFGALISPTDPVAVLGLFKTVKVPETLQAKMAGESLFNDGVGVVVFTAVVAVAVGGGAHGGEMGAAEIALLFAEEAIGGALLGLVTGYACYRALASIDEYSLEVLLTLALVMGTYALAIRLHTSGPIAMVVAGLIIGNRGMKFAVSETTRDYLHKFWSMLDEILNSVLFLLIGLEVLVVAQRLDHLEVALFAIPVALLARFVSVLIPLKLLSRRAAFTPGAVQILTWGGLRGGIAVALALSLPNNEYKVTILTVTYAVVLFSIIVQGLTMQSLVRKLLPED
jgi:CPA1 family monovalent cation:H+ antiporter